jgi:hypothetical protein
MLEKQVPHASTAGGGGGPAIKYQLQLTAGNCHRWQPFQGSHVIPAVSASVILTMDE